MGDLSRFLKKNKIKKENMRIPATQSLVDESGAPLLWEIRPLTTKEDSEIRDTCTSEVQVTESPGCSGRSLTGISTLSKWLRPVS